MARLVEVIEVETRRGDGRETPIRPVMQYFSKDGTLLAERDDCRDIAVRKLIETRRAEDFDEVINLVKEWPRP